MKKLSTRLGLIGALAILSLSLPAACGDDDEAVTVSTTLSEWTVKVDAASAPAGEITFEVENAGSVPHELVIIRSDKAPDALPVVDGRVPESEVDVIGEVEEFEAGKSESGTFDMEAGKYILICNLPAHYQQGMRVAFTVE